MIVSDVFMSCHGSVSVPCHVMLCDVSVCPSMFLSPISSIIELASSLSASSSRAHSKSPSLSSNLTIDDDDDTRSNHSSSSSSTSQTNNDVTKNRIKEYKAKHGQATTTSAASTSTFGAGRTPLQKPLTRT